MGARLRAAREKLAFDVAETAEKAGVHINTLQKLELGRVKQPTFETVARVAGVLKVPLATLASDLGIGWTGMG